MPRGSPGAKLGMKSRLCSEPTGNLPLWNVEKPHVVSWVSEKDICEYNASVTIVINLIIRHEDKNTEWLNPDYPAKKSWSQVWNLGLCDSTALCYLSFQTFCLAQRLLSATVMDSTPSDTNTFPVSPPSHRNLHWQPCSEPHNTGSPPLTLRSAGIVYSFLSSLTTVWAPESRDQVLLTAVPCYPT